MGGSGLGYQESALIKIARKSKLKECFAQFVWGSLETHKAVRAEMWQSNVRVGSNITPKSLTKSVGNEQR